MSRIDLGWKADRCRIGKYDENVALDKILYNQRVPVEFISIG